MTMILSCLTPDYAVQVSDRRLIDFYTRKVIEDESNKATLLCNRAAFAYSGLAALPLGAEVLRTDLWLLRVLAETRCELLSEAADALCEKANKTLGALGQSGRITFVYIGWASLKQGELRPVVGWVSNCLDHEQGRVLEHATSAFSCRALLLEPEILPKIYKIGPELQPRRANLLLRYVRRCVERRAGPKHIAGFLCGALRGVAAYDNTVGKSLNIVSLPRAAALRHWAGTSMMPVLAGLTSEDASFTYLPTDLNVQITYGPNFVCRGSAATGFKLTPR